MTSQLLFAGGVADSANDTNPSVTNGTVSAGFFAGSVSTGLTAAGTNVGTALQLTSAINYVSTAASGTGVVLPTVNSVGVGAMILVVNAGANAIKVYGGASDTIDGSAAGTGVTLTEPHRCLFFATAAATWISADMLAASA